MLLDIGPLGSTERLIALLALALAALVALWFVFRKLGHYRLIADIPTARIRSAPQGYVELIGHVIAGENGMLSAPLSGRPCVWYTYKVEKQSGGERKQWKTVRSGRSDSWFQINDGTGTCLVDPAGAEVTTLHKQSWRGNTELPSINASGLSAKGIAAILTSNSVSGHYRYTESLIFEHEQLYALGRFHTVGGGRDQLDMKATARDLLRDWKQNPDRLRERFDQNGDGQIDLQEWQQAQKEALQEARAQQRELHQLPSMNVLTDSQSRRQPYLLSTYDEERLMRRYRWISIWCLSLTGVAFWLFLEVLLAG
ncbi:GIDE domain-containing protein [Marinobacterium iners]|uniref:RING-type E3 ubiquitin transferase n=1 Tax=Marinobacterium iners DSM 11526 TaxID=1122198 RepID=A0A1H4FGH8_9GAMM|nr:GIDE domain-containing protein [Marinobacterium iners]SEA96424.1 E3 Ubiquitin ligase [Marinobacterium iners DSM 11526]